MKTDFSRFLRRRREELAKTQAEIAHSCGLTEMSITLVEAGRRRLSLERVPRLAAALQVAPAELCLLALRCRYPELAATLNMEVQ
jgi:transcriptional regulator with XRE-family HTH domain